MLTKNQTIFFTAVEECYDEFQNNDEDKKSTTTNNWHIGY